jgi:50S ribosomal subunit-associated GTPase HflX
VVHDILEELDVHKEMLYVFNKIDRVKDVDELSGKLFSYQPHVIISSKSKETMKPLIDFLIGWRHQ